jgi:hypothetical protein
MSCESKRRNYYDPPGYRAYAIRSKRPSRYRCGICNICGEWVEMITQEHAHRHGFKNADEMAQAGVVK